MFAHHAAQRERVTTVSIAVPATTEQQAAIDQLTALFAAEVADRLRLDTLDHLTDRAEIEAIHARTADRLDAFFIAWPRLYGLWPALRVPDAIKRPLMREFWQTIGWCPDAVDVASLESAA